MATPTSSLASTGDPFASGSPTPTARPAAGTFYPTDAERVLGSTSAGYQLSADTPLTVSTSRSAGLPSSGMSAVVANVTVTAGPSNVSSNVSVTAAPTSAGVDPAPPSGLLVVPAGTTRSSLLTIPLGPLGSFVLSATGGNATVTADVVGFYASDDTVVGGRGVSGGYQPLTPHRLVDATGAAAVPAGGSIVVGVDLGSAVTQHATALLVRVSTQDTTAPGTVSATAPPDSGATSTPSGSDGVSAESATSTATQMATQTATQMATVSFTAGSPASNLAVIPARIGDDGKIGLEVASSSTAPAGVVVDLVGFYDDGTIGPNLRFRPLPQTRVVDTRTSLAMSPLLPGRSQTVTPASSVVGDSTFGLVGVLTTTTAAATCVDLGPDAPTTAPSGAVAVGGVSVAAGTTSSAVQVEVATDRTVAVRGEPGALAAPSAPSAPSTPSTPSAPSAPSAPTPTQVTFDVVGSFEAYPPVVTASSRDWVAPVSGWQVGAVAR